MLGSTGPKTYRWVLSGTCIHSPLSLSWAAPGALLWQNEGIGVAGGEGVSYIVCKVADGTDVIYIMSKVAGGTDVTCFVSRVAGGMDVTCIICR